MMRKDDVRRLKIDCEFVALLQIDFKIVEAKKKLHSVSPLMRFNCKL